MRTLIVALVTSLAAAASATAAEPDRCAQPDYADVAGLLEAAKQHEQLADALDDIAHACFDGNRWHGGGDPYTNDRSVPVPNTTEVRCESAVTRCNELQAIRDRDQRLHLLGSTVASDIQKTVGGKSYPQAAAAEDETKTVEQACHSHDKAFITKAKNGNLAVGEFHVKMQEEHTRWWVWAQRTSIDCQNAERAAAARREQEKQEAERKRLAEERRLRNEEAERVRAEAAATEADRRAVAMKADEARRQEKIAAVVAQGQAATARGEAQRQEIDRTAKGLTDALQEGHAAREAARENEAHREEAKERAESARAGARHDAFAAETGAIRAQAQDDEAEQNRRAAIVRAEIAARNVAEEAGSADAEAAHRDALLAARKRMKSADEALASAPSAAARAKVRAALAHVPKDELDEAEAALLEAIRLAPRWPVPDFDLAVLNEVWADAWDAAATVESDTRPLNFSEEALKHYRIYATLVGPKEKQKVAATIAALEQRSANEAEKMTAARERQEGVRREEEAATRR